MPRPGAVTLDAFGTLLVMNSPASRLHGLLVEEGYEHAPADVERALRAEIRHYRLNHMRGRDATSLAVLRRDCAAVLRSGLGDDAPSLSRLTDMLMRSLRFEPAADALPALDALDRAGVTLAVVSNWDASLPDVLERLSLRDRFGAVITSATAGRAKPNAGIFARALAAIGAAPEDALHCGDDPFADAEGARRAGMRPVLLDRAGRHPSRPGLMRVRSLTELADLL